MRIDLVVFDVAGTTVKDDDAVSEVMRTAVASVGANVTQCDVAAVMGLSKPETIRALLTKSRGQAPGEDEIARVHRVFVSGMKEHYERSPHVREMPGAAMTFARLRDAGVRVALDTGFSRDILEVVLDRLGWADPGFLDATVASDEVRRGRPYPDMIAQAMRLTGVTDRAHVAKVGDTAADLREGAAAGCGCVVGVLSGTASFLELVDHPHTDIVSDLTKLPDLLGLERSGRRRNPRRTEISRAAALGRRRRISAAGAR